MPRLGSLSFFSAFLLFLIFPLRTAAGVAAPSSIYAHEAEADATASHDPVLDTSSGENASLSVAREEAIGTQPRGDVQPREKATTARSMRNLIASGVGVLLLPVLAMLVDSGYILSKVEDLQEKDPQMTDVEAYQKVLSTNTPAAVLSALLVFLAVATGANFAIQVGKLLVSMKRERDQEDFEKQSADLK